MIPKKVLGHWLSIIYNWWSQHTASLVSFLIIFFNMYQIFHCTLLNGEFEMTIL